MTPQTQTLPGGITESQLAEWEQAHGKRNESVFRGKVKSLRDPSRSLYFYFKKPTKAAVALAMSFIAAKELLKANDEFRNNCLLYAEPDLANDQLHKDEYDQAIGRTIGEQFKLAEVEVEKI